MRVLKSAWLRRLCREAGADDVGFVAVDCEALAAERPYIERAFPAAKTLISVVKRMNRTNIRAEQRSLANMEFHHSVDDVEAAARRIVAALEAEGIEALCPPAGFPMEAGNWGLDRLWVVSHKPVAVAAGMGRMGIHRNVIHPKFGNFILLETILLAAEVDECGRELDFSPCLECKLCVAACPVGAISPDGAFNFSSCYTHNYREFMGGFADWVETVAASRGGLDYRRRVPEDETISTWQSLAFGPNYKAAYCMAVCPAGEEVIGPFRESRPDFVNAVVRPLQKKVEPLYVVAGSDAEAFAAKRYPHKSLRRVRSTLRPGNLRTFLHGLAHLFQPEAAGGLSATYHFSFRGEESKEVTVRIDRKQISVAEGLVGDADLRVEADTGAWLRFIRRETHVVKEILFRRIRVRGPVKLLQAFGRCFPA